MAVHTYDRLKRRCDVPSRDMFMLRAESTDFTLFKTFFNMVECFALINTIYKLKPFFNLYYAPCGRYYKHNHNLVGVHDDPIVW